MQLHRLGREVEFVVLVEVISLNAHLALRVYQSALSTIARVVPGKFGKNRAEVTHSLWRLVKRILRDRHVAYRGMVFIRRVVAAMFRPDVEQQTAQNRSRFWGADYYGIMSNYIPPKANTQYFVFFAKRRGDKNVFTPSLE